MANFAAIAIPAVLGLAQQQRGQKASMAAANAQAKARTEQMKRTQEIEDRRRQERLRQALASQRARYGAAGTGGTGGSADALLAGLSAKADRETQDSRELLDMRINAINDRLARQRNRGLLEARNSRVNAVFDLFTKKLPTRSLLS